MDGRRWWDQGVGGVVGSRDGEGQRVFVVGIKGWGDGRWYGQWGRVVGV